MHHFQTLLLYLALLLTAVAQVHAKHGYDFNKHRTSEAQVQSATSPPNTYLWDATLDLKPVSQLPNSPWNHVYDSRKHSTFHKNNTAQTPARASLPWPSRDPAGFVDGPNLYAYVKQNPWTSWDPHGLATVMVSSNDEDEPEVHSNLVQEEKKAEIDDTTSSIRANVETSKKSYTLDHSKVGTKVTASAQGDKWVAEEIATKWDAYDRKVNAEKYAMQDALIEAAINIPLLLLPGGPLTKGSLTELAVARSGSRSLAAKTTASTGAESVNAGAALRSKLSALEDAQAGAASTRTLPDGRVRYYGPETPARTPGPTRGASYVTEHNPATGGVRSWMESYNQAGNVNRVHPKMINGQQVNSQHYPPTAKELGQ